MKTAIEMLDERLTIRDGHFKGARIAVSEAIAIELMEEYHSQFLQELELQGNDEPQIYNLSNAG